MYSFTGQRVVSQKPNNASKKRSVRPSSRLKTVDLDYRLSLSVARLVRFWFKSSQSLTAHDRQFLQGNLFLLAVCTHKVPLYLCSIFCSRSLVQMSTVSYRVFECRTRPKLYPVTLNKSKKQTTTSSTYSALVVLNASLWLTCTGM